MRFNIPISRTHVFWDALKEGKFVTSKCARCGHTTFPPQSDCPKCMSGEITWVDLGRDATLVTFTRVEVTPASFADCGSYIVAICELANGLRVLAWLEGADRLNARLGMRVRIEGRTSKGGDPYYVFVPA